MEARTFLVDGTNEDGSVNIRMPANVLFHLANSREEDGATRYTKTATPRIVAVNARTGRFAGIVAAEFEPSNLIPGSGRLTLRYRGVGWLNIIYGEDYVRELYRTEPEREVLVRMYIGLKPWQEERIAQLLSEQEYISRRLKKAVS
jgi:hypothetical protein